MIKYETKDNFRKDAIKRLKSLANNKYYKDKITTNNLDCLLKKISKKGSKLLFYIPIFTEVNILKYMNTKRGFFSIFVPFMQGVSFKMVRFRYPLIKSKFGIRETKSTNCFIKHVDIMVVPVVGVDGNYQRIGFGKGMYDRFYTTLKEKPIIIFIQLDKIFTNEKLCDDYDIQANYYVTPKEILKVKVSKNGSRVYGSRSIVCYN